LVSGFSDSLGIAKIPVLDLVGRYGEMGKALTQSINSKFGEHGLELLNFTIENVSVPPEVEAAIDKRSSMGAVGDLNRYTQFQLAESLTENPGGMGAAAAQMGAGLALGQQMAANMAGGQQTAPPSAAPPPLPAFHVVVNGAAAGPFDHGTLRSMVAQGTLGADTLVWTQGMASWQAASTVPSLAPILASAPPPIPPSN
jgi:hypothetical protein